MFAPAFCAKLTLCPQSNSLCCCPYLRRFYTKSEQMHLQDWCAKRRPQDKYAAEAGETLKLLHKNLTVRYLYYQRCWGSVKVGKMAKLKYGVKALVAKKIKGSQRLGSKKKVNIKNKIISFFFYFCFVIYYFFLYFCLTSLLFFLSKLLLNFNFNFFIIFSF